jgi:glycosyltransferase involved in cell wall biosynthesis
MKNSNSPLISVILPVYNVEKYVKEAIDSILNQTISDFEIIVIDDCSSDRTVEVIEGIDDVRIKLYRKKENKGLIDSLNLGFELASGEYIARMDGDDISVLNRFEKQLSVLEHNPDIILCGSWIQHFGESENLVKHKERHNKIATRMLLHCSLSFCASMSRRETLVAYRFDKTKKHVEDYDFLSRIVWIGQFYNIQEVLYYYRIHEHQVSTVYNAVQREGDIGIKLFLLKKINYSQSKYSDTLISNMLSLKQYVSVDDFILFLKFLDDLLKLNRKSKIFSPSELVKVLNVIKEKTIQTLFFAPTYIGINKEWRQKVLFRLPLRDVIRIVFLKTREFAKKILKK